jgi:hypothetical protein
MKMAAFWVVAPLDWYEFTNVSEVCTASIIRAMSEAARGRNGRDARKKSAKAGLSRTNGRGWPGERQGAKRRRREYTSSYMLNTKISFSLERRTITRIRYTTE